MGKYLLMVINEEGEERVYAKETDLGVFAAIEMVMKEYSKIHPLSSAVQVMAKKAE